MTIETMKTLWKKGGTVYNLFITGRSNWSAEVLSHSGFDTLTIDMQHGLTEFSELLPVLQGISSGDSLPFIRLNWNDPQEIMKALDYGAQLLICPMIENASDAAAFVNSAKYPPLGKRSFGPIRAALKHHGDYFSDANTETLTFAMIETASAAQDLEAIAATPGLDGLYIGPFDLSVSMGLTKKADFTDPTLMGIIDKVLELAKQHQLYTGIFTVDPLDAKAMAGKGFNLVSCGTEVQLLQNAAKSWLQQITS